MGVESIFAALFLGSEPESRQALDRLWSVQIRDGRAKGAWAWFEFALEPWETSDSQFFGAALAALAVGSTPSAYRENPEIRPHVTALTEYLIREEPNQPIHNRLMQLWASTKLPGAMTEASRRALIEEVGKKQQADGGWAVESLGAWKNHGRASASPPSNSYATALAAFILPTAGVRSSEPVVRRALEWLAAHQDSQLGSWPVESMNKNYEPDSMPARFMRDAATAFAALALLAGEPGKQ